MQANLIIYDVGSTYTKVAAYNKTRDRLELLGRGQVATTIDDIQSGIGNCNALLGGAGIEFNRDCELYSTSSAAGGLRMVAMGYMPRVTAKAAKEVAMNAGARVLEIITHEDPPDYRVEILREIKPDIILLAGGTDGGDQENLLDNARHIVAAKVKCVVVIAGNVEAQPAAEMILKAGGLVTKRVPNVMPTIHELEVEKARAAIHEEFIKQISNAKGLHKLVELVSDGLVVPTPGAILLAAELLARGTHETDGVGDLIVIDIGGATTDIHSILPSLEELSIEERGLVVTNARQVAYRTVEGNLGMRISSSGILSTVGPQHVLSNVAATGEDLGTALTDYVHHLEENPEHIARTELERLFDLGLAVSAIEVALKRHAGYIAQEFNPVLGIAPGTPMGRDLRQVKTIIAVGGIFTHAEESVRHQIVEKALQDRGISLLPVEYELYFDGQYLLYTIGVLSRKYPDLALRYAKEYLKISHIAGE